MLGDDRRHFSADASGLVVLMDNQHLAGLPDSGNNRFPVKRLERAQIQDMRGDAMLLLQAPPLPASQNAAAGYTRSP